MEQNVQNDDKGRGKGKDGHEGAGINGENDSIEKVGGMQKSGREGYWWRMDINYYEENGGKREGGGYVRKKGKVLMRSR